MDSLVKKKRRKIGIWSPKADPTAILDGGLAECVGLAEAVVLCKNPELLLILKADPRWHSKLAKLPWPNDQFTLTGA